jgi:insertion element IS1 protein InsB
MRRAARSARFHLWRSACSALVRAKTRFFLNSIPQLAAGSRQTDFLSDLPGGDPQGEGSGVGRNVSFVGSKKAPRWLWEALDHQTGRIVASTFGRRVDQALLKLKAVLTPFGIRRFSTDGWGAYHRHLDPQLPVVGKRRRQQLEQKQLILRTRIKRLVRRTICFSKSVQMHDIISGLFINRFEFGLHG